MLKQYLYKKVPYTKMSETGEKMSKCDMGEG